MSESVKNDVPRAASITARHMQSAYLLGNRRQRRRIEIFGYINRAVLKELGARITKKR